MSLDDEVMIHLEGVGKRYVKYDDAPMLATALLRLPSRTRRSALWAVRGLDLSVKRGEVVGIIGHNGSGKSTTLQMISGITAPTEGSVRVRGRIAPLISVGVGFHPELSGRDNLYVNGAILGLSRAEIDRRFDDVVAFAEMESFIDTPVKFYSSGMAVRLGFSMSIQATPDVLVVDEVLAVGDLAFQLKCYDRMAEIREQGTTILVVSHNLNAIRASSDRVVVMDHGEKKFEGDPAEAIALYHDLLQEQREMGDVPLPGEARAFESGLVDVESIELIGASGRPTSEIDSGDRVTVRFTVKALADVTNPFIGLVVQNAMGTSVYGESNAREPYPPLTAGSTVVYDITFAAKLTGGSYTLRSTMGKIGDGLRVARIARPRPLDFYVTGRPGVAGVVDFQAAFGATGATGSKGARGARTAKTAKTAKRATKGSATSGASTTELNGDGKGQTRGRNTRSTAGRTARTRATGQR